MSVLRKAKMTDVAQVFMWRNDPEIYRLGKNQRPVTWREHIKWWRKKIDDDNTLLFMVKGGGILRLDRKENEAELSIYLVKENRGKGMGVSAIREACQGASKKWPGVKVIGEILPGNMRSVSAFEKAGFKTLPEARDGFWRMAWEPKSST